MCTFAEGFTLKPKLVILLLLVTTWACSPSSLSSTPLPTSTPPMPAGTPTPLEIVLTDVSDLVQGSEYGAKVLRMVVTSDKVFLGADISPMYLTPKEGNIVLEVIVEFYRNGEVLGIDDAEHEVAEVSVSDSTGETYQRSVKEFAQFEITLEGEWGGAIILFEVPGQSKGFKLHYRDVDVIGLGY